MARKHLKDGNKVKSKTREELIEIMRNYAENIGFPTQRKFVASNNLPCYYTYINEFGSFKNAILESGIVIPDNRKSFFDRIVYNKEEIIELITPFVDEFYENNNKFPTCTDIDNNKNIPSSSAILKYFKSIDNFYMCLGYNRQKIEKDTIKKNMKESLVKLCKELGKTPSSRDMDKYSSLKKCYSSSNYALNFGSILNAQRECGVYGTYSRSEDISKEELLNHIDYLYKKYDLIPLEKTLERYTPSNYKYHFGGWTKALMAYGFTKEQVNARVYYTNNGAYCKSIYEMTLLNILEKYNISYETETLYKNHIDNFKRLYRFDVVFTNHDKLVFVEIFGMIGKEGYQERADEKVKLCKDNDLDLICFWGNEMMALTEKEILNKLNLDVD